MNEEILSRLERIDHKEYSGGFEFADSSTFDEMARCFEERKILAKEIERLKSIIKEAREYIGQKEISIFYQELGLLPINVKNKVLEILDKVGDEK